MDEISLSLSKGPFDQDPSLFFFFFYLCLSSFFSQHQHARNQTPIGYERERCVCFLISSPTKKKTREIWYPIKYHEYIENINESSMDRCKEEAHLTLEEANLTLELGPTWMERENSLADPWEEGGFDDVDGWI